MLSFLLNYCLSQIKPNHSTDQPATNQLTAFLSLQDCAVMETLAVSHYWNRSRQLTMTCFSRTLLTAIRTTPTR